MNTRNNCRFWGVR